MEFRNVVILAVLILVPFIGACTKPAATVDGKAISREKVDLHMKERLQEHKLQTDSVNQKMMKDAIVQELIDEQLAVNEAAVKGIIVGNSEVDKEIDALKKRIGEEQYQKALKDKGLTAESYRNRMRERMTLDRFIESLVKPDDISDQEMQDFYTNSSKPFLRPARVYMKIVEFQAEEAANAAVEEMKNTKASFDDYADKLAAEKKASVTDYGWVNPEFFSPSMASSIKSLKVGQQGGPYKGQTGFYLVRVKERQNEGVSSFEEVKETIRKMLLQQKRSEAYMSWIAEKRKTAKIVINIK